MLIKTRGIVFHALKYSETSIITRIYTESLGLQSYIINGVRVPGSRNKASLFQPLNILDLEIYKRENRNLQRIKEFKTGYLFRSIPFNIVKSSIALFIVEVLNAVIKEEEQDEELFQFIEGSITSLDKMKVVDSNFHLHFLLYLTRHLGFFPGGTYDVSQPYFDLKEGCFVSKQPQHDFFLKPSISHYLTEILSDEQQTHLTSIERRNFLTGLLRYYELHVTNFKTIKSHKVLHEIFDA